MEADQLATTVSNVDLADYLLSNFKTVDEVREAMPKIRVVRNAEIENEFGTPLPLHHIVSDATGASIAKGLGFSPRLVASEPRSRGDGFGLTPTTRP